MSDIKKILFERIAKKLKIPTIPPQMQMQIIKIYNSIDPSIMKGHKLSTILEPITDVIIGELDLDTHEMLKSMIGTSDGSGYDTKLSNETYQSISMNNFLGLNDLNTLRLLFNPSSLYISRYVSLSAIAGSSIITDGKHFQWKIGDNNNVRDGFCNPSGPLTDIVAMRSYQSVITPPTAGFGGAQRFSLLIEEFSAQSFIAENGRRFHFTYLFTPVAPYATLLNLEDENDCFFRFQKPMTTADTLTISIGNPLELVELSNTSGIYIICHFEFICLNSDK